MQASFAREIDHFAIFLENCDGESYNELMESLSWIYENMSQSPYPWNSSYFNAAIFECAQFAAKHFGMFWSRHCNQRDLFSAHKSEVIAIVAYRLAVAYRFARSAPSEFKLGNVYEGVFLGSK